MTSSEGRDHRGALGEFIRAQRRMAQLSQRELARISDVSDAYISQLERGMHEPTVKVLRSIAAALDVRANTILQYAGWLEHSIDGDESIDDDARSVEDAIRADRRLSDQQKEALLSVYQGFVASAAAPEAED